MYVRISQPRRKSTSSLVGLMVIVSKDLGFLTIKSSITPERVNRRILISVAATIVTVCSVISQDTLISGKSITT